MLQCRRDEQKAKVFPHDGAADCAGLGRHRAVLLLDEPERYWMSFDPAPRRGRGWRAFLLDAHWRIEALAIGQGWDIEYPRDLWRLCKLGIDQPEATFDFIKIGQPWLKELAKRWARWQLSGSAPARPYRGPGRDPVRYLPRGRAGGSRPAGPSRPAAAGTPPGLGGRRAERPALPVQHVGGLNLFLQAIRQHRWDDTLAAPRAVPRGLPLRAE